MQSISDAAITTLSRPAATWYSWLLTGFYLYSVNLQGNVVPFLQAEFALSYRAVSLHSSAIAVGIIRSQKSEDRRQISGASRSDFRILTSDP